MGGKSSTISTSEQRILSLQVQQSSQGLTLPVVYGRNRVAGNLIWYGDFTTFEHRTETRQGGKGGGGVKQVDVKYTYEAAVALGLCEGPIKGITKIWRDKEKFLSPADLRLELAKGEHDQPVWPHLLQGKNLPQAIAYSDTAYLRSPNYQLTNSAQVYSHNFEVDGKLGYSASIPDANPADILQDLLSNPNYGCGFPAENLGDFAVYGSYCRAAGLFLSPVYGEQSEARRNISELLRQTNAAAVFSQGSLKIVPYGDAPLHGNGAAYIPNLTPLYDLDDDDFIATGSDPVKVERKTNADAYNQVQIEYLDRANDYNIAVAEAKDQANIEQYGLRPQEALKMHAICDKDVAQQVAQLTLQRALYVRNEYEFKLGWKYVLLEPMDLVTLTDAGLGLDKTPVRIIEIEEDEDGLLKVRAEDFPAGTANAAEYPTQDNGGYSADYNVSPGNASAPVMFEAPLQLTGNEPQIWLATGGGEYWGGCEVWVSADGDSYSRVGTVNTKARYGSLQNALPSGAVYDRINTADVQIGAGHLHGASEEEARQMVTACWLDGEFLAYQNAELTGLGRYTLSNLTRGAWGSAISEHGAGAPFVRLDEALFRYRFDKGWLGKTVWVKLVSFNVFGSGMQELGEVPAYPYTIIGAPLGEIANLRLTSGWTYGRDAVLAWDKLDGADSYDVEVYAAQSQTRLRRIEGIIDNRYSYTLADMKADGGQMRDVVFRVRARAVTGKTGNWAQAVARNPQLQSLSGIELDGSLKQVFFRCAAPQEEDFAGIRLWVSEESDCPATDANLAYDGRDTFITVGKCAGKALEAGKTYYLRAAGYDSFGKDGMNVSSSHAFTVYEVSAIAKDLGESALSRELVEKINDSAGVDTKIQAEASARIAAVAAAEKKAADALAAKARELGSKITSVENIANGQTQRIETLTAAGRTAAAALEEEKKARADGDAAEARARQAVAADLEGQIASVSREQTVLSEKDKSRASEIAALSTRVGQTEGSVTELRQSSVTRAQVETIAQDAVSAKFQNTDTRNDNRPPSWYWEHYPRRTASEFKSVGAVGLGGSGYAVVETVVPWENVSGGQIVQTAYLSDGAVKRRVSDAVRASQGGRWVLTRDAWGQWAAVETTAGAQAKADAVRAAAAAAEKKAADAAADLNTFKLAQANKDTATAKRIDTLTTTVNNSSATVQATAQSIKGLEAQYTVKVDVNGHVAGYGLATTLKDGKPTSAFIVSADRFGIGAAGAGDIYPFTVDTQTQTVGINGKLIVNGKAIIDKLNAGDISADKLQANSIGANLLKAGAVTAEKLAAKAVTAEKLQVDKLSAISADMGDITAGSLNIGKGRFTVDAQGTMTIRADAKRNVGLKISNEAVEVYDEAGVLRVRLGKLE